MVGSVSTGLHAVQKTQDLREGIVVKGPTPVRHSFVRTPVHHGGHEYLVHLVAIAALHEAEIDAALGGDSFRTVTVRAGAVEELWPRFARRSFAVLYFAPLRTTTTSHTLVLPLPAEKAPASHGAFARSLLMLEIFMLESQNHITTHPSMITLGGFAMVALQHRPDGYANFIPAFWGAVTQT